MSPQAISHVEIPPCLTITFTGCKNFFFRNYSHASEALEENCTLRRLLFTFPGVIFAQVLVVTNIAITPLRNNFLNRGVLDKCNITSVFSHALERSVVARVLVHACWCRALGAVSSLAQRAKLGDKFWFLYVFLYTCLQKETERYKHKYLRTAYKHETLSPFLSCDEFTDRAILGVAHVHCITVKWETLPWFIFTLKFTESKSCWQKLDKWPQTSKNTSICENVQTSRSARFGFWANGTGIPQWLG